jgi:beta-glucanase (GH16 family)
MRYIATALLFCLFLVACKDDTGPLNVGDPRLVVYNLSFDETNEDRDVIYYVRMMGEITFDVPVDYLSVDGSAIAGVDYEAFSGQLVFGPGEMIKELPITIKGNELIEDKEEFTIEFSSPVGDFTAAEVTIEINDDDDVETEIDVPAGYSLEWHDEFNREAIDASNWTYETGDGTAFGLPAGWGNDELQIYTNSSDNSMITTESNASVLAITARENGSGGYTSAKLTTNDLVSVRFGRIDVRAKMPEGQGLWPAVWMLGDNRGIVDWPGCGEIDIVEVLGHEPDLMYATVHYTNGENRNGEIGEELRSTGASFSEEYHVFTLEWTPEIMAFFVDGQEVHQVAIQSDMKEFLRSFYLILNVAVGGNWPGDPDGSTVFTQTMYVDYVRVFSKDGFIAPEPPVLDIDEETVGQDIEPNIGDNAIRDDFTDLGNIEVIAFGGGGEPFISASETAVDGDMSLVFDYPGGAWGGAYILMAAAADVSGYDNLKFSLNMPAELVNAEIKLESPSTNAPVFLEDYTGVPVDNGFMEYTIPLADFGGLDLTSLTIPFAIWNPVDAGGNFLAATVLIDNLYFSD